MCDRCDEQRAEIKRDMLMLLENHPDSRLLQAIETNLDSSVAEIWEKRIEPALLKHPDMTVPDRAKVREVVRDCLTASVLALAAACMASSTPGYTDEGGEPRSMILGMWAGTVMGSEADAMMEIVADRLVDDLRNFMGPS